MTWRGRGPLMIAAFAACVSVATAARLVVFQSAASDRARRALGIRGDATAPLYPGASQRLGLRLRNRRSVPLLITRIRVRVRVDRAHRRAGLPRGAVTTP